MVGRGSSRVVAVRFGMVVSDLEGDGWGGHPAVAAVGVGQHAKVVRLARNDVADVGL